MRSTPHLAQIRADRPPYCKNAAHVLHNRGGPNHRRYRQIGTILPSWLGGCSPDGSCLHLPSTRSPVGLATSSTAVPSSRSLPVLLSPTTARANALVPPAAATLVAPTGTSSATPSFSWMAVTGATHYQLWVNDAGTTAKIYVTYTAAAVGCGAGTGRARPARV